MAKIISFILSLFTVLNLASDGIIYGFQPTLEIDAAVSEGEISSRASGYLYGIAQSGVPDAATVESLDVSSVSQKVIGGLQHPVGDVDDVASSLGNCDYITVYLQDCYDTWYYCTEEINSLRAAGTYDCAEFVQKRFLPLVRKSVEELSKKDYADRLVYCMYNEADNAVWFGTPSEDGTWLMFDDAAKNRFYEAWKVTYELIRSIDPDALIGGPGNCDYDSYEIRHFLEYCTKNNCVPDIMIYHELGERSAAFWQDHVDDYRQIEKSLGVDPLPIIVTEYGCMFECGNPADMLQYIVSIEKSGTYGNMAFWRLANNLNDTCADATSPNSNWWLYRWYADMEGDLLASKVIDIMHSDFANVIKYGYKNFHYDEFNGISSLNTAKNELTVLCGGCDYTGNIQIKNLNKTNLGSKVNVKIEAVYYEGLTGVVNAPVTVKEYTASTVLSRLSIKLENPDPTAVYRVVVTPCNGEINYKNTNLPVRYEFEHGTLSGTAYTYDSAYATTGEIQGMVGGLEKIGDSITIKFSIPESGEYNLALIFGNSNDGRTPNDRKDSLADFTLDGKTETLSFPNTIKSEYTDKLTLVRYLEKGEHTMTLSHRQGTFVLDSLLVSPYEETTAIAVLPDADRSVNGKTSFLAVAPDDGFYNLDIGKDADFTVDSSAGKTENGKALIYLRRGLNYIDINCENIEKCVVTVSEKQGFTAEISPEDMTLSGGATLSGGYVDGISSDGGNASFTVTVPESGSYRMTVTYSNNLEGGVHSYNVDLIESYITVSGAGNLWCRNTYSWDTCKTATINLELTEGENVITFSNDGSVIFNNTPSQAPRIYGVTVNKTVS